MLIISSAFNEHVVGLGLGYLGAEKVILPETKGMRKWNFLGKISEETLMKMTRYSEPQIVAILRQAEGGVPVSELCREHGMR